MVGWKESIDAAWEDTRASSNMSEKDSAAHHNLMQMMFPPKTEGAKKEPASPLYQDAQHQYAQQRLAEGEWQYEKEIRAPSSRYAQPMKFRVGAAFALVCLCVVFMVVVDPPQGPWVGIFPFLASVMWLLYSLHGYFSHPSQMPPSQMLGVSVPDFSS
jgi:hypothetical protein